MSVYKSEKRTKFYQKSGLPFYDAIYESGEKKIPYSYALYTCLKEPKEKIEKLQKASVLVAQVFEKVLKKIKKWDVNELEKWGFDKRYAKLLSLNWDDFFGLRVGWAWNNGDPKVMEINSQTPSFWFEAETGNKLLSKEFKLKDPTPFSEIRLQKALNQSIEKGLDKLHKIQGKTPKVGFVTAKWYEDLHIMNWLVKFCDYDHEVLDIEKLDFTKKENIPFNRETNTAYDVLILWYPLEWVLDMKFVNGDSVFDVLVDGISSKSFSAVHLIPSFFIQPKTILAYITENQDTIFIGKLKKAKQYFAKTYLSPKPLGETYIAKPFWGREGRGCYILKKGEVKRSRYQEDYYIKQPKVYQELLDLSDTQIEDKKINLIYEAWVYRVNGKLEPGGVGSRGSQHLITDDFSYWLPIGV